MSDSRHAANTDQLTRRLARRLTAEWVPVDLLLAELADTVPPGQAIRFYRQKNPGSSSDEDTQVRSGSRSLVVKRLNSLLSSGKAEQRGSGEAREVRLVVQTDEGRCPSCHRPTEAPVVRERRPARKNVLYPKFPQWPEVLPQEKRVSE